MRPQPPDRPPTRLPTSLDDIRKLLQALDVTQLQQQIQREADTRLAIVGPVNSGKSTLFNLIMGRPLSPTSPIPGTTRTAVEQGLGPFMLIDTPGFAEMGGEERAAIALRAAATADALVLVFDAAAGLRQTDMQLLDALKRMGKPLVIVANKIDLVGRDAAAVETDMAARLGVPVIAISAKKGTNVGEHLLPALVDALPDLAVLLGRHLPAFRHTAAMRVVRHAMIINGGIAAEPIPFVDLPLLLAHQARMILRLAAIYGEPFSARHARELISTIAGSVALRYLAQEAAKAVPMGGSAVAAGIAAVGTWGMGQVAIQYFESGKRLSRQELRSGYRRIVHQAPPHFEGEPGPQPDGDAPAAWDANLAQPVAPAAPGPPPPDNVPGPDAAPAAPARRLRFPFGRRRDGAAGP